MRRADRLFQIVQHLRARRLTTAAQLADLLEVSERTVYRDISDLSTSGVPIKGEAGVGYKIDRSFELTPLMFDGNEVEAVIAGLRMAETFAGPTLRRAAQSALNKVILALPPERRGDVDKPRLFAPSLRIDPLVGIRIDFIRDAIAGRQKVAVTYLDEREQSSERVVRPLALYFWGSTWTLAGWCELRVAFRNFRLDRIDHLSVLSDRFEDEQGKTLPDFVSAMRAR